MKTLETIQQLNKAAKIICAIIHGFCVAGVIASIIGIICLAVIPDGFKIGGVTIYSIIENSDKISLVECYTTMIVAIIVCLGFGILCKLGEKTFENELSIGTPFSYDVSKGYFKFGILTICIPLAVIIAADIVITIIENIYNEAFDINLDDISSVGIGLMFIIISIICKYGAEMSDNKTINTESEEENE